jgi:flagellar biosynthesis protein FlhF
MKVQRFIGSTSGEALDQVRNALGPNAMILSNRSIEEGIEILACSENDFKDVVQRHDPEIQPIHKTSFPKQQSPIIINTTPAPTFDMSDFMGEIRSIRDSLQAQISELSWGKLQEQNPIKSELLRELFGYGFSASLSRYLIEKSPLELDKYQTLEWMKNCLVRNISTLPNEDEFLDQGGVYALVGPTGVGKTTTTAKIAARYVMRHGSSNLALITTDGYRIGAEEQLRIYGKILGVMVHSVKDEVDLNLALNQLKSKHMVLIDTVGMSQRDQKVSEQIAMLSATDVPLKRLLCVNATTNIETLYEVVSTYTGSGLDGCVLTKIDEAVNLGNALDVIIRQKLRLYYLSTGQRVPEDISAVNPSELINQAFVVNKFTSATLYEDVELPAIASTSQQIITQKESAYVKS